MGQAKSNFDSEANRQAQTYSSAANPAGTTEATTAGYITNYDIEPPNQGASAQI